MAKEQSELSPFKSRFAPETFCTPAQFLAESMVSRICRKENGHDLPQYFWNVEKWKRLFLLQVRHASALLRLYSVDAIVKALRDKRGSWITSLGAKSVLDPLVREEQRKLDLRAASAPPPQEDEAVPPPIIQAPRPALVAENTLSKLKGL